MTDARKSQLCALWLSACLHLGWRKADLDDLQRIWWESEGWRYWHGQY